MKITDELTNATTTLQRRFRTLCAVALAGLVLSGCSATDTPAIDMCQKIVNNLLGESVSSWEKTERVESDRELLVEVAYTTSQKTDGEATCTFRTENGEYRSSPNLVMLDGQKVGAGDLMAAAMKSSGKIFKETAEETVEQTKELAGDAKELAGEASEKAAELAEDARELAGEASERAAQIAEQAGEKAREAALEATKAVQETLEKKE